MADETTIGLFGRMRQLAAPDGTAQDALRAWSVATAAWLVLVMALAAYGLWRPQSLSLGEIGAFLSGALLPPALGWLYGAVVLQAQALRHARAALDQAFDAQAQQFEALARAGTESTLQTRVLLEVLETARNEETYEEFQIRLYYLAKFIHETSKGQIFFVQQSGLSFRTGIWTSVDEDALGDDRRSVDRFFERLRLKVEQAIESAARPLSAHQEELIRTQEFLEHVAVVIARLAELLDADSFRRNGRVAARVEGAALNLVRERLETLQDRLLMAAEAHLAGRSARR